MDNYTGTDNLEVMACAVNYNQFLASLVTSAASGSTTAVDFGAGIGHFASIIRTQGIDVTCIEPDTFHQAILSEAKHLVLKSSHELADNSVEYIYSLNVLEHIERDDEALRDLYRIMKPGGKILLYLPAMNLLYSSMDRKVGHYRRYSKQQLLTLVKSSGLIPSQCRYADSLGFFATLVYKLTGNREGNINRNSVVVYDRFIFPFSKQLDRLFGRWFGKNVFVVAEKL